LPRPKTFPHVGDERPGARRLREPLHAERAVRVVVGAHEDGVGPLEERGEIAGRDERVVPEDRRAAAVEDLDRLERERVPGVVDLALEGEAEDERDLVLERAQALDQTFDQISGARSR